MLGSVPTKRGGKWARFVVCRCSVLDIASPSFLRSAVTDKAYTAHPSLNTLCAYDHSDGALAAWDRSLFKRRAQSNQPRMPLPTSKLRIAHLQEHSSTASSRLQDEVQEQHHDLHHSRCRDRYKARGTREPRIRWACGRLHKHLHHETRGQLPATSANPGPPSRRLKKTSGPNPLHLRLQRPHGHLHPPPVAASPKWHGNSIRRGTPTARTTPARRYAKGITPNPPLPSFGTRAPSNPSGSPNKPR